MPLTTAAGPIAIAEQLAADTLAASTAFQTLTGAANAATALASIYFDALPPPEDSDEHTLAELQEYRPLAILATDESRGIRWRSDSSGGSSFGFRSGGCIYVQLERDIPEDDLDDAQEYCRTWKNEVGAIISNLLALAGGGSYLAIREIELVAIGRSTEEERQAIGDVVWCVLKIDWGRI